MTWARLINSGWGDKKWSNFDIFIFSTLDMPVDMLIDDR